jgi:hypothetical protein
MMQAGDKILLAMAIFLLSSGCAVNDVGFVSVHNFENESCYLHTINSWGGYLSTRASDASWTFGYTRRIMLTPKREPKKLNIDNISQMTAYFDLNHDIDINDDDLGSRSPYAWIEETYGLILHFNQHKIGITGGAEIRNIVFLPMDFNGIFVFKYHSDGKVEGIIQEDKD